MSEIDKLVTIIRDSKLIEMSIQYDEENSNIKLKLVKNNELINVNLFDIREFQIFDASIKQEYIGQIKGFLEDSNSYWLSLDPYDERVNELQDKDNYVFNFNSYEIIKH
ncbi:hypothetical protein [Portibacter lacus]|uniref:Uncharacterized protein n=1 Tax=Portibacter lacus TaxID=1099794 RepID=A0AA37SR48_9BACT|nr:hypothetical protein [Portibacter lacus]GLR18229.1 hypothetical protein GCM10007940_28440 [Portibacter lacus]